MNEIKIPTIQPDKYYSKIINKEKIISFLQSETNINKIEKYVKHNTLVLKNYPKLKIDDVVEIMEFSNYRINQLKGLDKISEVFENVKKESPNLNNIEIIYTPAHINDKNKEGYRHAVTYIKINDELYEAVNVDRILAFLGNKEILKNLSEYEIVKFLKENSNLIKTNYLDYNNSKITSEQVEEEIKKESDANIRNALLSHKDDVVKEREKLEEYINKNAPGTIVTYGVNSNEERIYTVKDKLIKFEGKDRTMQILSSTEIENMKTGEFENNQGYENIVNSEKYDNIVDFLDKQDILIEIIDKIYREETLTTEEIEILTNFLNLYITNLEENLEIPEELNSIAEKWYENSSVGDEISKQSQELQEIYERTRAYRKNKVKVYELNDAAFISTFAILESALVIGLIIALIYLFK